MSEEEMKELIQNAFQRTLKELKENPSNVFNYLELQKRYNGVLKDKVKLQQDNKKLNKQLENCYCNRTDCSARIKDSKKYDSLVQRIEKHQKEFIEWLEIYIEDRDKTRKLHKEYSLSEEKLSSQYFILQQVLSKYKEIIGDKE